MAGVPSAPGLRGAVTPCPEVHLLLGTRRFFKVLLEFSAPRGLGEGRPAEGPDLRELRASYLGQDWSRGPARDRRPSVPTCPRLLLELRTPHCQGRGCAALPLSGRHLQGLQLWVRGRWPHGQLVPALPTPPLRNNRRYSQASPTRVGAGRPPASHRADWLGPLSLPRMPSNHRGHQTSALRFWGTGRHPL